MQPVAAARATGPAWTAARLPWLLPPRSAASRPSSATAGCDNSSRARPTSVRCRCRRGTSRVGSHHRSQPQRRQRQAARSTTYPHFGEHHRSSTSRPGAEPAELFRRDRAPMRSAATLGAGKPRSCRGWTRCRRVADGPGVGESARNGHDDVLHPACVRSRLRVRRRGRRRTAIRRRAARHGGSRLDHGDGVRLGDRMELDGSARPCSTRTTGATLVPGTSRSCSDRLLGAFE